MNAIEVTNLHKEFKGTQALKNINLIVQRGELFGLIGPDGAGKTTLLRILTGVFKPTRGAVAVSGIDVVRDTERIKEKIGVMPQVFSLYPDLTVEENLWFFSHMYRLPAATYEERKERLLRITRLSPFLKRRAEHLSGGMQKKLMLTSSLLHTPEILLLDEPTTGVDPVSRRELWDFLHELFEQGITIIVSTPYMDEAERCSRIGFLHRGELLLVEDPQEIKKRYRFSVLEVSGDAAARLRETPLPADIAPLDMYRVRNTLHIIARQSDTNKLMAHIRSLDARAEIRSIEPTFEDAFTSLIQERH